MNDRTPTEATLEMRLAGLKVLHALGYTAITASDMWPVYRAMLAASPPAPAAEPVAWQWRFRAPNSDSPAAVQWSSWADGRAPDLRSSVYETEERPLYTHPLDAAAIRAEARREALEEAAAWHDDQAALHDAQGEACGTGSDGWKRHTVAAADHRRSAASIRALAGEVG